MEKKIIISNDKKKKEPCSSVNIYEKKKKNPQNHKFIVSNTKYIEKKNKKIAYGSRK